MCPAIAFWCIAAIIDRAAAVYSDLRFDVQESINIKDYSNARIALLSVGREQILFCKSPTLSIDNNDLRVYWYYGNTKSLQKIQFDLNGLSESHRTSSSSNSSSSAFRILFDNDNAGVNRDAIVVRSINISDESSGNTFSRLHLLNGILACASRQADSYANSPVAVHSVFHLMTLLTPLPISNSSSPTLIRCPPGYWATNYSGQPICWPCLPGEYSQGGISSGCRACPVGQSAPNFASAACSKLRRKRSASRVQKAKQHLEHRRLPLADFRSVVMYQFFLVLLLSTVVPTLLLVSALSFDTVWNGVLSGIEVSIVGALDDRFVLNEPSTGDNDGSETA